MDKVKIKEIADELGLKPKEVLDKCHEIGIDAKSHASSISTGEAERLAHFLVTGELLPSTEAKIEAPKEAPRAIKKIEKVHSVEHKAHKKPEIAEEPEEQKAVEAEPVSTLEPAPKAEAPVEEPKALEIQAQNIQEEEPTPQPAKIETPPKEPIVIAQPEKRRGLVIVKKANLHKEVSREPERAAVRSEGKEGIYEKFKSESLISQKILQKPKKPTKKIAPVTPKKDGVIKIDLLSDRELSYERDEEDDNIVVLPDLSMQNIRLDEDEPNVEKKQLDKNRHAARRPAVRQTFSSLSRTQRKKRPQGGPKQVEEPEQKIIEIPEDIRVYEFADKIGKGVAEVIKVLFALGKLVTKNDFLDKDEIEILANEFGVEVTTKNELASFDYLSAYHEEESVGEDETRPPIVTVMGHVDHGKTTLLDTIRKAKVASGEAGGITQHIGAYTVVENGREITFIDTPGHEAFTHMRARGAQVTDIAIIIVAADDGVMPQTREAINHVRDAKVPFIVAVNKIDKPGANPDFVKTQLSEMGVTPLDWGGEFEFVHISAKKGENIDTLLDTILLQADIMDLKANPAKKARAIVVESSLEKGRGPVATVIVKDGTLRVGDNVVAGAKYGKVRAILDDMGKQLKELGPSQPGQILGLDGVPKSGDAMVSVENDKMAKDYARNIKEHLRQRELSKSMKATFDDLHHLIAEGKLKRLDVVIKADVQGSLEAIIASLEKIRNEEVKVNIVHSGVGQISESDVELASAGANTLILGFNVKPSQTIKDKAKDLGVDIKTYSVIFELIDDIKMLLGEMLSPTYKEEITGKAEIRSIFSVSRLGNIAGCMVTDGTIYRNSKARVFRGEKEVYAGSVQSLKRFKDDVREVKNGFECGIVLDDFSEISEGDVIECYKLVQETTKFKQTEA